MEALVIVDCQNDFCEEGSLPVEGAYKMFPSINILIDRFASEKKPIFALKDWHPKGHVSFASSHPGHKVGDVIKNKAGNEQVLWPDHCIQEGYGSELDSRLHAEKIDRIIKKGSSMDSDSYSGFLDSDRVRSTGFEEILREAGVDSLIITGMAMDYCVRYTVLDALAAGFESTIVLSACASIGDIHEAAASLEAAGSRIVATPEDL